MNGNPLLRASMTIEPTGGEQATHINADAQWAQAQIHGPDWTVHLTGKPTHWRSVAKLIEDAAMEAERLMAEHASAVAS